MTAPPSVLPDISPARGEIGCHLRRATSATLKVGESASGRPISPLAGEMSGRTEGGVKERRRCRPYLAATLRKSLGDIPASLRKDLLKALSEPKPESMATLMTLTSSFISSAWA